MKGREMVHPRVKESAQMDTDSVLRHIGTPISGLGEASVDRSRKRYGENEVKGRKKDTVWDRLRRAFVNPFSMVLFTIAVISALTDLFLENSLRQQGKSVLIILVMLLLSGLMRFWQELRAKRVADRLTTLMHTTVTVKRDGEWEQRPASDVVVGDLVSLLAGDRVPADLRLTKAVSCYVTESTLTGESGSQGKHTERLEQEPVRLSDYRNTLFMGSTICSGYCQGVVLAVGADTVYGGTNEEPSSRKNLFDRGANSIAWVLIRFMLLFVPVVFVASGLTQGDWMTAFLFALSVAVGLTPELLPMVITACMARGSICMSRKQTLVKNINAMQGFGSMDVLCVDKTGTLTDDTVLLEYDMDILGKESQLVLDAAYLNSAHHSGAPNHLDLAILKAAEMPGKASHYRKLTETLEKLDECPFDYPQKTASVLLRSPERNFILVKGDVDSVLSQCSHAWYQGEKLPVTEESLRSVHLVVDEMLEDGMKVLAVAARVTDRQTLEEGPQQDLTLLGYLGFFDAPRESAASAIEALRSLHIGVKVLTGDQTGVARSVCRRLRIPVDRIVTGAELETLSDNEIQVVIEQAQVFAELTPSQKAQIVRILQSNGHSVGFLGDGMNDLPALTEADVGISVDNACEAAKEAADVILMKKDLNVLEQGVLEGRKAFANMNKYIRITASSNFGNICAIVVASVFLPFFSMTSLQLLLLNLLYDIMCLVLPWDRVDRELLTRPLEWSGRTLSRFMLVFGPVSSLFDLLTFGFLMLVLCPMVCGGAFSALPPGGQQAFIALFQTGWFLESMWTQVLILLMLRSPKPHLFESSASRPVWTVTMLGVLGCTVLVMTPLGGLLGMTRLPSFYFLFLAVTVLCYLLLISVVKRLYLRRFHDWM